MNKQQLAAKIWESANQMRSKIEANEYKDYILGFIFYKYLSDTQVSFLIDQGMTQDDIKALTEDDTETVNYIRREKGYFIAYDNLFSTWVDSNTEFDESNVRDALSAFNRLINKKHKKLFEGIFTTLETGLSKLGETSGKRTKAISDLLHLIKAIPMTGNLGYDVLGYIYEYLIEKFAANAGKKAGEFYTPYEVSLLMSEITAHELKHKDQIEIYDPTSGSGSLLINIGSSVAKYAKSKDDIKYYAQELKQSTYNLTRMNLIMRGILPDNITTRNGDTLEDDWPYFDESNPQESYQPLYVDAVVSNPPYSQKWDPENKENDPRYARFGLAPKTKADFAFLLHDLYHLKPDGIMTIVLPHGVLFRGGEEGEIRKQLIENNHIDAIIGLPANIFFGTGIPTVILVLKQKRENNDVLIVDASKHFVKEGKNNKLQDSDIKRITDAVIHRQDNDKFSKLVSKKTIQENEYNLNIPRYVDSSPAAETWDLHATMLGGIPNREIVALKEYWDSLPELHDALFSAKSSAYSELAVEKSQVQATIAQHPQLLAFIQAYNQAFDGFDYYLKTTLIEGWENVNRNRQQAQLSVELFERMQPIALVDKYQAYQLLSDQWKIISADLEMMQTEGFAATKQVDPNMVTKKKDNKETEVQEGWKGHIMPFELVQKIYLNDDVQELIAQEAQLAEVTSSLEEIIEAIKEEDDNSLLLNDKNDAFVKSELTKAVKEIYADVDSEEITLLNQYVALLDSKAKKPAKLAFIEANSTVGWTKIEPNKDGTYGKGKVNAYLQTLRAGFSFDPETIEGKVVKASQLLDEQAELKADIKKKYNQLHIKTKTTIEKLSDKQINTLLELKWITPLCDELIAMPSAVVNRLTNKVQALADKYAVTYSQVANEIQTSENELAEMMGQLTGDEFDMQGLAELTKLLKGE
ncbi:type I restriction-modification system subunit M [Vibrio parahaemolyticus]|uniref:type I restriction-modification system subunit M n=1 Tax=Vibrio parahaemolyticus TaxID=670 RepID=UPI002269CDAC|nr:type I restriction-modification system subunit M [Vibrio parahaemolyticus]MCX8895435.1 type I restriction-modification system subunit M [Vibrio parahaemolyticus]HCE3245860.1 type I restriction-modification system subunit M [Vibrio parahaemolyticus]